MSNFLINFGRDPGGANVDEVLYITARIDVLVCPKMCIFGPCLGLFWNHFGTMLPFWDVKRGVSKIIIQSRFQDFFLGEEVYHPVVARWWQLWVARVAEY